MKGRYTTIITLQNNPSKVLVSLYGTENCNHYIAILVSYSSESKTENTVAVLTSAVGEINCAFYVHKIVTSFLWVPMHIL